MIKIRQPIWKDRSIGVAEHLLKDPIEIQITYKNTRGEKIYPDTYTIPDVVAKRFPTMTRKGVKLHLIPISALKIKENYEQNS